MNKKQRAQVVELLRCAADLVVSKRCDPCSARTVAANQLGIDWMWDVYRTAAFACHEVGDKGTNRAHWTNSRARLLLEAAQRVEEGSYP